MHRSPRAPRRFGALLAGAVVLSVGLVASPAQADTAPADTSLPTTVTSDGLPTAQINGVVWKQEIVGNTVYVAGSFTSARPAGAAAGTNEQPRSNLMAYNLTTGALLPWAPSANGQVKDLALSPDGKTLYASGQFTTINGQTRTRVAAFDVATGALSSTFRPAINSMVSTVAVSPTAVFLGGSFSVVNGATRQKVAAVSPATGANLPLTASIPNGSMQAIVLAPDYQSIVIGGSFTTVNGSSDPGYGLARLDAATGASLPLPVNQFARNAGDTSAILSLETDGEYFYGTGYHFGAGGNIEGTFAADWATGGLVWVEDCHGDTYSSFAVGDVVYSASHKHYCGNSGGFPQTEPWTFYRATAVTKAPMRINTPDIYGYADHDGEPSPQFLNWYPTINTGTYTGKTQGPWTVTGNDDYVLFGGEFTRVNNVPQQGIVRFAVSAIAPDADGPRLAGTNFPLNLASFAAGTVRVSWQANYDRDNETLVYRLYRASTASPPISTQTLTTPFWDLERMGYLDEGLTPGSTQRYRLSATDPFGNVAWSPWVNVVVSADGSLSDYAGAVLDDDPASFWRLGEPSGTTVYDWAGWSDAVAGTGVTRGVAGAVDGDTDEASGFSGTGDGLVATQAPIPGPQVFTIESWFRTTTTAGGKIVGFGNASSGNSSSYDRHVYMEPSGRVTFGVYPGASRTVTTPTAYNDGQWHHVVATLSGEGMRLYLDGKKVGQRTDTTSAQGYSGYWRIGGDSPWSGAAYFAGDIDDVAIYDEALTLAQVDEHWTAAGGTSSIPPRPADAYGAAVYDLGPDLYWRLAETSGTVAADTGTVGTTGSYSGAVTRGVTGPVASGPGTAVSFDGAGSTVASTGTFTNPTVYSEELWFRTTTTNGGKLIGFGNSPTGQSSNYDRHVYMENDGRLTFGVWTGSTNTITTPEAWNDGAWHHMVATQSGAGMALYVDGVLRGTHPQTQAQSYTGHWRIGGDTTWGPQPWFAGDLDEVAVYPLALSAATVAQHHALGSGAPTPNQAPTASFTATPSGLTVAVDGSGSTDPDGTVVSYAWVFGDGATATGSTASHPYAEGGTHPVTLTVTDDDGATATSTQQVTVTAPPADTALARDTFTRVTTGGWGAAATGGAWTSTGTASRFSTDGSAGVHTLPAGATLTSSLAGVASTSTEVRVSLRPDKVANGGGAFVHVQARRVSATEAYGARLRLQADGSVQLHTTRGNGSPVTGIVVPGLTVTAGTVLNVRVQVEGTSPTAIRAKVWAEGTAEPATWQVTATDATASLQVPGGIGLSTYLFGTVTNGPLAVAYDDLWAGAVGTAP